jgi:glycosyltransferase involved in cell wall biosynthesis
LPPRVSIVITNHNYGRFVSDAIESALAQTHPECDVVVVDDGSTDGSLAVIERYAEVVAVAQPNLGQAAAFNAGLERALGDVVIFLDADDVLDPDTARTVAEAFDRAPATAKVMYRLRVVDESGSPTGELKPPTHLPLRSGDLRPYVLRFPFDMTWMATSGNAFRRTALTGILPVPEHDYPILADFYLSQLTPLLGEVVFLDVVGGSYRLHGANSYEREAGRLDLEQVRHTIVYSRRTAVHLVDIAQRLDLEGRPLMPDDVLSVSEVWQRIVSLRLDPERHPVKGDTRLRLLARGFTAAGRRFDVSPLHRVLLCAWVIAVAALPRVTLPRLVQALAFMRRDRRISVLLGRLHRR